MPAVRHSLADQLGTFQDGQVTGYGRSRQFKGFGDFAEAQLPMAKQCQNSQASGLSQAFQDSGYCRDRMRHNAAPVEGNRSSIFSRLAK